MNIFVQKDDFHHKSKKRGHGDKKQIISFFDNTIPVTIRYENLETMLKRVSKHDFSAAQYALILSGLSRYMAALKKTNKNNAPQKNHFHKQLNQQNLVLDFWFENRDHITSKILNSPKLNGKILHKFLSFHGLYNLKIDEKFANLLDDKINLSLNKMNINQISHITRSNVETKMPLSLESQKNLHKRLKKCAHDLRDPNVILRLTWSLAALDSIFPDQQYRHIGQLLKHPCQKTSFTQPWTRQQYRDASFWFEWEPVEKKRSGSEITSRAEKNLTRFFNDAGYETVKIDNIVPIFNKAVDFSVVDPEHKNNAAIHIELDGPQHYINRRQEQNNYTELNGRTIFRSALINKSAPDETIIRIPYNISEIMIDRKGAHFSAHRQQRKELAHWFMTQSRALKPGIYHLQPDRAGNSNIPLKFDKIA